MTASVWVVVFCSAASVSMAQGSDRNALAEPCSIVTLSEAQAVLSVPMKPKSHHRCTSQTDVRTACDFVTTGAQPTLLRVIKTEFANEVQARDYLEQPADHFPLAKGVVITSDDGYGWQDEGMFAELFGRKANAVVSLTVFPGRDTDVPSTQAGEAQFKRLLALRQQILSRLE